MKREYPLFTLYCERNVTSAQMVEKHLKAPLFHERSGKPRAQGFQISLSDCRGITFLAVLKGKGSIGVDAEDPARQPPAPLKDIFAWTDLEARHLCLDGPGSILQSSWQRREHKRRQTHRPRKYRAEGSDRELGGECVCDVLRRRTNEVSASDVRRLRT